MCHPVNKERLAFVIVKSVCINKGVIATSSGKVVGTQDGEVVQRGTRNRDSGERCERVENVPTKINEKVKNNWPRHVLQVYTTRTLQRLLRADFGPIKGRLSRLFCSSCWVVSNIRGYLGYLKSWFLPTQSVEGTNRQTELSLSGHLFPLVCAIYLVVFAS